ncbi:NTP transferase domain-containing protein [Chthonomonas calidirosea]|uniref:NTP transferase domain-containing protein n=1 Tax=Chthonomonas calidirosea TaxID=454171 RepID=UPI0006EC5315|nr:NTP transferase domain-containing protein [Chthonomonas calidirosea]CEK12520.1 molybdopterin-guanine dinucleotide biosynthesis protein A [Chthonomonas calidirosea]
MELYDAILPADGRIDNAFAAKVGTTIKALIPWQGQTLLSHTLSALQGIQQVRRIVVIGNAEVACEARCRGADAVIPPARSAPENIALGIRWLNGQPDGPTKKLLLLTTDLPFLSAEVLNSFLHECPANADLVVPVLRREVFEARFPNSPAIFVRLKDGYWTTGCVFCVSTSVYLHLLPLLESLFHSRKSQWKTALRVGPVVAWRFFTHQLTVPEIVQRAERLLQCRAFAHTKAPPEVAYDIDDLQDYDKAFNYLTRGANM